MTGAMASGWGRDGEILQLAGDSLRALAASLALITRLLVALLRPLFRVLAPAATALSRLTWRLFWAQPARAIALQTAALLAFLALLLLEHRFGFFRGLLRLYRRARAGTAARYASALDAVARQSRMAAAALPHILFLAVAGAAEYFAVRHLPAPARAAALLAAAVVAPVSRTVRLLYSIEAGPPHVDTPVPGPPPAATPDAPAAPPAPAPASSLSSLRRRAARVAGQIERDGAPTPTGAGGARTPPVSPPPASPHATTLPATGLARSRRPRTAFTEVDDRAARREQEAELLQLWVCAAGVGAGRAALRFVCPALLAPVLARLDAALLYVFVWMQAGPTKGCRAVFRVAAAALGLRAALSPRAAAGGGGKKAVGEAGVAGQRVNLALRVAVAVGALSQPRADELADCFAESGVALAGVVFFFTPGFLTFAGTVLVALLAPAYFSAGCLQFASGAAATRRNWLTYWAVFAVVEAVWDVAGMYLSWVPLWYHAKMAVVLWLQLPYYRGAAVVLHYGMHGATGAVNRVTRSRYTPRKFKVQ